MSAAPIDIRAKAKERILRVTWNADHLSNFEYKYLRCQCGCAVCVDERTGVRRLDPVDVGSDIDILDMSLVGNYAVQFRWSDGHDTGIYSWDYLLRICPCERCGGAKTFERPPPTFSES